MVQLAEAYFNGKKVKPIWNGGKFSFKDYNIDFTPSESDNAQLFWDMGGIIKNRPSIYTLLPNPDNNVLIDSGLIWGEDIIDLILADRGKVVLPLRNLQGFNELDDALNFADNIAIGIDWSDKIEASHSDFKIDIVDLLHQLIKRNQVTIIFYSLNGEYPYIPAGTSSNLELYLAYLTNKNIQPSWAKEVFLFE
ncbi:MAG: hypothetical protein P8R32_00605 [Candidatus Poseidoniia archaeon]|nr:hypothetical protein [Candidatus Poseidoniia archaeon]